MKLDQNTMFVAAIALFGFQRSVIQVIAGCAVLGLLAKTLLV